MVRLHDGTWLAAYMIGPSPTGLRIKRSSDSMRTWEWMAELRENGRDLDNANLYQRADGAVLLAMRSVVDQRSYRINVYQSDDSGNSWQFLSTVAANENSPAVPGGVWEPFLFTTADGRVACLYANEMHSASRPSYSQIISERISGDGGATWGDEIFAVAEPGSSRPGEPNLTKLGTGFLLFYEVCGSEPCVGHTSFSADGVSWPGTIGPPIPGTYQDAQGLATDTGPIFAVSNERIVLMSVDSGESWNDTGTQPFAFGVWPALYQTEPGEIALVMTGGGDNGEAGEYIRFGSIANPASSRLPESSPVRHPLPPKNRRAGRNSLPF
jgi:hypothetical protein